MPTLTLDSLYVHDAADPDDFLTFDYSTSTEANVVDAVVQRMANGRLRAISRPGLSRPITFTCLFPTRADTDALREWTGTTVMVRDQRHRVVWGVFRQLDVVETLHRDEPQSLSFTLEPVTFDEEV